LWRPGALVTQTESPWQFVLKSQERKKTHLNTLNTQKAKLLKYTAFPEGKVCWQCVILGCTGGNPIFQVELLWHKWNLDVNSG
jgi:hypothetical protein